MGHDNQANVAQENGKGPASLVEAVLEHLFERREVTARVTVEIIVAERVEFERPATDVHRVARTEAKAARDACANLVEDVGELQHELGAVRERLISGIRSWG